MTKGVTDYTGVSNDTNPAPKVARNAIPAAKRYYSDDLVTLYHGDCCDVMATLADESVDAVVTDPPYGIGFMGKEWDGPAIRAAAQRDQATRSSLGPDSASRPGRATPRSSSAFGNEAIIAGPVRGGVEFQFCCQQWA